MQNGILYIASLQFCLPHSVPVSPQIFFSLFSVKLIKLQIKKYREEEIFSRLQISYLSHLDICQLNNPQPRFGEELLGCDTVCGLEFKESAAKECWKQRRKQPMPS